jgi:hypothetical protein
MLLPLHIRAQRLPTVASLPTAQPHNTELLSVTKMQTTGFELLASMLSIFDDNNLPFCFAYTILSAV